MAGYNPPVAPAAAEHAATAQHSNHDNSSGSKGHGSDNSSVMQLPAHSAYTTRKRLFNRVALSRRSQPDPAEGQSSEITTASGSSLQGIQPRLSRLLSGGRVIDVMKVDTEGHEPDVFDTAKQLLADGRVQHIILEYSPGHFYHRL